MRNSWLATVVLGWCAWQASAQGSKPPQVLPAPKSAVSTPSLPANSVAATVNGTTILEGAVQRGLKRVPPEAQAEARKAILDYLIDNLLLEQYLVSQGIKVEAKDLDAKLKEMKEEIVKEKMEYAKVLQEMGLTEAELREHMTADIRWEKYIDTIATDKLLRDQFTASKESYDGSMVRARHILLMPDTKDPQKIAEGTAQLRAIKKSIQDQVAAGLAKLPANTDNLTREKTRVKLLEDAFAAVAKEKSACSTKSQGGDVGWFDRTGDMVEPFAKAAFALKPFEMTDVVQTQFGVHLILVLDRKPGKDVKFESVKAEVREVYAEKVREHFLNQLRARAKITITPVK